VDAEASARTRAVLVWVLLAVTCVAAISLVLMLPASSKTVGLVYGAF
jgi:hypothetical protein